MAVSGGESIPSAWPMLDAVRIRFDSGERVLQHQGRSRHLAPREVDVLLKLLDAGSDVIVSRWELLDEVWHDQEVSEEIITVTISRLRRHFKLLGVSPNIIQTVPKSGYRLHFDDDCRESARLRHGPTRPSNVARLALVTAMIALLLAGSALAISLLRA